MAAIDLNQILAPKENLARILDNLKEGVIAHDLQRRIFFFNRQAEIITGFRREEILGRDCHEAFGIPFCGERCSFCENSPPAPDAPEVKDYTLNITTKNCESRRLEMTVTLMRDREGGFVGVLALFKDITDELRLMMQTGNLTRFSNIVGRDAKMLQVFQQISDVAAYDYPVHIFGDTGTGKELVATAIHNESHRAGTPFVPINCGALPEGLIESELFGHVKGAFSGAIRDKKGRFELADGGTIFLDEVAELSKNMQVKLLRFLQEGEFERVGGEKTLTVSVKVISATNKDLKEEVRRGRFREDLYYRLSVIPIFIPPLRERKTDIPLLANHFMQEAAMKHGQSPFRIAKEALALLMDYSWPGNVRELQNAIQFAFVKSNGRLLAVDDLPMEIKGQLENLPRKGPVRKLEVRTVKAALKKAGGNKSRAARLLGVGRATLYRFLNAHPEALPAD
ncbi:MAG: sigma 54-interacting transcriptional regulator [Desulfobacterales bacterium]|nr:sigma 54-interacting transcriptional regulator [Desulfobacterales bacterium]